MYSGKIFDIQNTRGVRKYTLLSKVIKNCISYWKTNATVERSLSDKKTLRPERTSLSAQSWMGLRQMKEHASKCLELKMFR